MIQVNPILNIQGTSASFSVGRGAAKLAPIGTTITCSFSNGSSNQVYFTAGSAITLNSETFTGTVTGAAYFVDNVLKALPFSVNRGQSVVVIAVRSDNTKAGTVKIATDGISNPLSIDAFVQEQKRPEILYGELGVVPAIGPVKDDPFSIRYSRTNTNWSQVNEAVYTYPVLSNEGEVVTMPFEMFQGFISLFDNADGSPVGPAGNLNTWTVAQKWRMEFDAFNGFRVYNYGVLKTTHVPSQTSVQFGMRITSAPGSLQFWVNEPALQSGPARTSWILIYTADTGLSIGSSHRIGVLSIDRSPDLILPSFQIGGKWRTGY